ncbi:MAG: 4Fe-4S dicluster domain-containing protein [bacterium]
MEEKIIKKNKINKFLQELKKEYKIFAPVEKDGDFRFSEILAPNTYHLPFEDYRNTKISPKEIFFPQTAILYEFDAQGTKQSNSSHLTSKTLIFGIRPCDTHSFSLLDKVFGGNDFQDPYYVKKREQAIIISLSCIKPQITCFCTSLDGKPDREEGADIIFFDLEEDILVKPITEKGKEFIKKSGRWFENAKKSDIDRKNKIVQESMEKISSQVNIEKIKEKLDKSFDASFWNEIHQKCLGCGVCTYLCPTCHCFDISDDIDTGIEALVLSRGKRMRSWDSCMFPLFTLHASGHNPRPTYKERMRQRIMHKFNYCPENFKEMFCVGCGRCIRNCPVNLDIREVIKIANG